MSKFKTEFELLFGVLLFLIAIVAIVVVASNAPTDNIDVAETVETTIATVETEPTIEETTEPTEPETYTAPDSLMCDTSSELEMLACVIYQEVGGNSHCDMCRYRVADVVLNRIAHGYWGDTMYDVLTAKSQYGKFHWTGIKWADRAHNPYEAAAVDRAYKVARDVLNGNHSELYGEGYIWQAEFVQGTSGFWCCGHYFAKS